MTTDVENGGPIPPKQPVEDVAFLNAKRDEVMGVVTAKASSKRISLRGFLIRDISQAYVSPTFIISATCSIVGSVSITLPFAS